MPYAAKKPCSHAGCKTLVSGGQGKCDLHKKQVRKAFDEQRGSASERGYNHVWAKARATYLRRNPLCVMCKAAGRFTPAKVVDHIVPHKGDQTLFWDSDGNWQSLCATCHSKHKQRLERANG